jgi:hypothetical protein
MKLRSFVDTFGTKSWDDIVRWLPNRSPRQCRDRYNNYLQESLVICPWTPEEDAVVIQQYHEIGPKWVEIGKMLRGRSGNNVKNRWHKHLCRVGGSVPPALLPSLPPVLVPEARHAPSAAPEPRPAVQLQKPLDHKEIDWSHLFDAPEPSWGGGSSLGESLF